jgi:hypothetical protein
MSANDDCNKITGLPIPKAYREAYETQGWFYNTPDCTYGKNPPSDFNYCGPRAPVTTTTKENYTTITPKQTQQSESQQGLDYIMNASNQMQPGKLRPLPKQDIPYIPIQTDVIYFQKSPTDGTYYAYPNAYPAYPYMPCVFPNTSSESYS